MDTINTFFLLIGALLFFSIIATTLSARIGLPFLLIFLVVGMLAGEGGIGGIRFDNFFLATLVSQLCLAVILLDGGLNTKVKSVRMVLKPASVLATWGVVGTVLCLGLFINFLFDFDTVYMAFLMASIVGSTDAAAVFSLLRNSGIRLFEKVQATLEIESGANDPMAILLVTIFIGLILNPGTATVHGVIFMLLQQLGLGLVSGIVCGSILGLILIRISLPEGLYALLIVSGGLLVFAATNKLGGSGFLAVYLAGIIIGNLQRNKIDYILKVTDGLAWLAQACMFLVLGLLVDPERLLFNMQNAFFIALFLMFVARPFAVWTSLYFFNFTRNEKHFISWVGLRGAVPVTLAILPVMMGVPNSRILFDIGFAVVIFSLLFQGSTIPLMAKVYKVILPPKLEPDDSQYIWVGDKVVVNMYCYKVDPDSDAIGDHPVRLGKQVDENNIRFFAMVRKEKLVVVDKDTKLEVNDIVWYVATQDVIGSLAKRFNNTRKELNLNLQFFGEFNIDPSLLMNDLAVVYGIKLDEADEKLTANEFMKEKLDTVLPSPGDRVALGNDFFLTVKDTDNSEITQLYLKVPSD